MTARIVPRMRGVLPTGRGRERDVSLLGSAPTGRVETTVMTRSGVAADTAAPRGAATIHSRGREEEPREFKPKRGPRGSGGSHEPHTDDRVRHGWDHGARRRRRREHRVSRGPRGLRMRRPRLRRDQRRDGHGEARRHQAPAASARRRGRRRPRGARGRRLRRVRRAHGGALPHRAWGRHHRWRGGHVRRAARARREGRPRHGVPAGHRRHDPRATPVGRASHRRLDHLRRGREWAAERRHDPGPDGPPGRAQPRVRGQGGRHARRPRRGRDRALRPRRRRHLRVAHGVTIGGAPVCAAAPGAPHRRHPRGGRPRARRWHRPARVAGRMRSPPCSPGTWRCGRAESGSSSPTTTAP